MEVDQTLIEIYLEDMRVYLPFGVNRWTTSIKSFKHIVIAEGKPKPVWIMVRLRTSVGT